MRKNESTLPFVVDRVRLVHLAYDDEILPDVHRAIFYLDLLAREGLVQSTTIKRNPFFEQKVSCDCPTSSISVVDKLCSSILIFRSSYSLLSESMVESMK